MLQAISNSPTVPFARVPWNEPGIIMKMLDAGTCGIIAPMINNKEECLEEEFEKFDDRYSPKEEVFDDVKKFFTSYLTDEEFRKIIDSKEYAKLSTHPLNDVFPRVPKDLLNQIPTYIKDHVSLNKFL